MFPAYGRQMDIGRAGRPPGMDDERTPPHREGPDNKTPPWRSEGRDPSRLMALSDGIFAFAMTLLVLGLALPSQFDPAQIRTVLGNLRTAFLAYILSFFVIWFYWRGHHQIFRYIVSYDRMLLDLNVVFLLSIAVMPFSTNLLSAAGAQFLTVLVYALNQVAAGSALTLVWVYAARRRRHVDQSMPAEWVAYLAFGGAITPIVFAVSIPIALWNPTWAEYSWVSLFVLQIAVRRRAFAGTILRPIIPQ